VLFLGFQFQVGLQLALQIVFGGVPLKD